MAKTVNHKNPEKNGGLGAVRLKRDIFAIDSTTLKLSLDSINWARHRRKKAVAKTHMSLNVGNMLPTFAVVEGAAHHDSMRADALCAGLKDGDVLLAHLLPLFLKHVSKWGLSFSRLAGTVRSAV